MDHYNELRDKTGPLPSWTLETARCGGIDWAPSPEVTDGHRSSAEERLYCVSLGRESASRPSGPERHQQVILKSMEQGDLAMNSERGMVLVPEMVDDG